MEIKVEDGTVFDLKIQGFCIIMPCQLMCSYWHFKRVLRLHHQGQAVQGWPSGSFSRMCLLVDIVEHHRRLIISNLTISAACCHMLYHTCTLIMSWPSSKSLPCPSPPVALPLMLYSLKCLQYYKTNCYTSLQSLKYFRYVNLLTFSDTTGILGVRLRCHSH